MWVWVWVWVCVWCVWVWCGCGVGVGVCVCVCVWVGVSGEVSPYSSLLSCRPLDKDRFMAPDMEATTMLLREGKVRPSTVQCQYICHLFVRYRCSRFYLPTYLSIYLSIYLPTYLSTYLSTINLLGVGSCQAVY